MAYEILLVEDDPNIRDGMEDYFRAKKEEDLRLITAENGEKALVLLYEKAFDLVLLDIMLPGMDGFSICRQIRKDRDIPIIFLTARGREEDILYGYAIGCDDYIVKPFSMATLYAKIHALLNRSKGMVVSPHLKAGNMVLDPKSMVVTVSGEQVMLPLKQYEILKLLLENKGNVVTRDAIVMKIWGYDYEGEERILDNHMKKLRKALGDGSSHIKTVIGKGYKVVD